MIDKFIQDTSREAGKITLNYFKHAKVAYTKRHSLDVVTHADLASNKYIIESIKAKFPQDGIISEETGEERLDSKSIWIIDPLDGTLNFSKGIPTYCVLIAHAINGVADCGVVYDPVHDDLYFAEKNKGAYLNGDKIICSNIGSIDDAVGLINSGGTKKTVDLLDKMIASTEKKKAHITSLYCLGLSTAQVATGQRDWLLSPDGGNVWDYAAGSVILIEAGCMVTNIKGDPWTLRDNSMIAANPEMHKKIMKAIK